MGAGGFPIDLILFGMIAAFLVLRLKSILGRRTGFERPPQPVQRRDSPVIEGRAEPPAAQSAPATSRVVPEPISATGQTLARMATIDRSFTPTSFLDGAEKAFQIIVRAFAAGDRAALQPLLGSDTWNAFDLAITDREKAGQTHVTDIKAVHQVTIESAELNGTTAAIAVRFVSDQVNLTKTQGGAVISGTDAVTEITDLWTFERDLAQPNPAWHLVAARSA
jgi:predicted lipid-binding transport protein (Tim44 family)